MAGVATGAAGARNEGRVALEPILEDLLFPARLAYEKPVQLIPALPQPPFRVAFGLREIACFLFTTRSLHERPQPRST